MLTPQHVTQPAPPFALLAKCVMTGSVGVRLRGLHGMQGDGSCEYSVSKSCCAHGDGL